MAAMLDESVLMERGSLTAQNSHIVKRKKKFKRLKIVSGINYISLVDGMTNIP